MRAISSVRRTKEINPIEPIMPKEDLWIETSSDSSEQRERKNENESVKMDVDEQIRTGSNTLK